MAKLVVVGNIAFDTICRVSALPEKNTGTLIEEVSELGGGCAANVAWTASQLGIEAALLSRVGCDFKGSDYEKKLAGAGIDLSRVATGSRLTAHSYMFSDKEGNQQIYYSPGSCDKLPFFRPKLKGVKIAHFAAGPIGDYMPFFEAAKKAKCVISFDPGQEIFHRGISEITACLPYVNYLFLNHRELLHLLKKGKKSLGKLFEENPDLEFVCESRGKEGAFLHERKKSVALPAVKVDCAVEPTGAGDAHRAGFLAAILRGSSLEDAGRFASGVAAEVVKKQGAQGEIGHNISAILMRCTN